MLRARVVWREGGVSTCVLMDELEVKCMYIDALALELRQQLQTREEKESRESDAVEDAHYGDEGKHGMGEEGRVSLELRLAWMVRFGALSLPPYC